MIQQRFWRIKSKADTDPALSPIFTQTSRGAIVHLQRNIYKYYMNNNILHESFLSPICMHYPFIWLKYFYNPEKQ